MILGSTTAGSSSISTNANRKYAVAVRASASATITTLSAYVSCDTGGAGTVKLGIYANTSSLPAALLGTTAEISVPASSTGGWVSADLTSSVAVTSGTYYWLAAITGTAYVNLFYRGTSVSVSDYATDTYSDGFTDPWGGSHASGGYIYCIYGVDVSGNLAPYAPTIKRPADASIVNIAAKKLFSWSVSDPNGDRQASYKFMYRETGTAAWTDTGWVMSPYMYHEVAASTFSDGVTYEWTVQVTDGFGIPGPIATIRTITGDTIVAPTITSPIDSSTVSANPTTVTWSYPDQTAYQVRTVADSETPGTPDTDTVYQDTGTVTSASIRSQSMTFATSGRYEHVQVRVRYNETDWTDWGSSYVDVDYTPPATPTIVVTAATAEPHYITVAPTQPAPEGAQPTVVAMHVYRSETDDSGAAIRIAASVSPSATYADYQVKSGQAYYYFVRAVGDNNTYTDSTLSA